LDPNGLFHPCRATVLSAVSDDVCAFDRFHGRNEIGRVEPVSGHESFVSNPLPMSVILSMDVARQHRIPGRKG
jgi:hypothetical protein